MARNDHDGRSLEERLASLDAMSGEAEAPSAAPQPAPAADKEPPNLQKAAPGQEQDQDAPEPDQQGFPSPEQQGFAPPAEQQGFAPPADQPSFAQPVEQQGFGQPAEQPGFGQPAEQQGFVPPAEQQPFGQAPEQPAFPSPEQQGFAPQAEGQGFGRPAEQDFEQQPGASGPIPEPDNPWLAGPPPFQPQEGILPPLDTGQAPPPPGFPPPPPYSAPQQPYDGGPMPQPFEGGMLPPPYQAQGPYQPDPNAPIPQPPYEGAPGQLPPPPYEGAQPFYEGPQQPPPPPYEGAPPPFEGQQPPYEAQQPFPQAPQQQPPAPPVQQQPPYEGQQSPYLGGQQPYDPARDNGQGIPHYNPLPPTGDQQYPPAQPQYDPNQPPPPGYQQQPHEGYAQPHYPPAQQGQPQPPPQSSESLSSENLLGERRIAPSTGWRRAVYKASGGNIHPGESQAELRRKDLIDRARNNVVGGHHRVAVMSLKGGVGKTTTTTGLGSMLSSLRGDRVIAVDANPDRGTLSDKVRLETAATVRDLLNGRDKIHRYADVRAFTSQNGARLEVLASDRDPAVSEAFSAEDYSAVAVILEQYYSICITDCGTGLLHSAMSGVLALADQLVLVSSPSVDGARSASATLDWLEAHDHGHLVRNGVVVLSMVRNRTRSQVDLDKLQAHFESRCRAVVRVPYDDHLEEGAEVELEQLAPPTREAYLNLAAVVGDGFSLPRPQTDR